MRGSRMTARAMAVRCFCPPESVMPRSPTTVSYLWEKAFDVGIEARDLRGLADLV